MYLAPGQLKDLNCWWEKWKLNGLYIMVLIWIFGQRHGAGGESRGFKLLNTQLISPSLIFWF